MIRATLFALLLLSTAAAAQDDGCSEAEPCEWVVTIDERGFDRDGLDELTFNGTLGDWYRFSFLNADTVDHTVTLESHDSWTIAADEVVLDTDPFELVQDGKFALIDEPSGDSATVQVFLEDVVDLEQEEADKAAQSGAGDKEGDGKGTPGFGLIAALVAVGIALRRR